VIRKQPVDDGQLVKVTFRLPAAEGAPRVSVVGDFNDWDPAASPLRRRSPTRSVTVTLTVGRRYAFRYVDGNGSWFNDEAADDYVANGFGGHDGVIDLTVPA
jgi:1,4-alpha-glucan branching enzyme